MTQVSRWYGLTTLAKPKCHMPYAAAGFCTPINLLHHLPPCSRLLQSGPQLCIAQICGHPNRAARLGLCAAGRHHPR